MNTSLNGIKECILVLTSLDPLFALVLFSVLAAGCLGAQFWIAVPGGFTPQEVETARAARRPGMMIVSTLLLAMSVIAPLLILGSTLSLFFSYAPPRCLVLSSRSRLTADARWSYEFEEQLKRRQRDFTQFRDAGPLVDAICAKLQPDLELGRVKEIVSRYLRDEQIAVNSTSADGISYVSRDQLPPWMVQSVEVTVLRYLMSKDNYSICIARFPDRSGGTFQWGTLANLLSKESKRLVKPSISIEAKELNLDLMLHSVIANRADGTGNYTLSCLFFCNRPVTARAVTLVLKAGNESYRKVITVACDSAGYFAQNVNFAAVTDEFAWTDATLREEATGSERIVPSDPNSSAAPLFVAATPAVKASFDLLKAAPALAIWREELSRRGILFEKLAFRSPGSTAPKGIVSIVSGDGYAIISERIPADFYVTKIAVDTPARVRINESGLPGLLSFDGLPLTRNEAHSVRDVAKPSSLAAQWTAFGGVNYFRPELETGANSFAPAGGGHARSYPSFECGSYFDNESGRDKPAVFIGLDYARHGLLPDSADAVDEEVLAAWTTLLVAVYRVRSGALGPPVKSTIDRAPVLLMSEDDMEATRSRSNIPNVICFAAGLCCFSMFVAFNRFRSGV